MARKSVKKELMDRFLSDGISGFSDYDALTVFLCCVTSPRKAQMLAQRLLRKFGELHCVFEAEKRELNQVEYMSEEISELLRMIPQLARRYRISKSQTAQIPVTTTELIGDYITPFFIGETLEKMYMLTLDAERYPIDCHFIFKGNINMVQFDMKELVAIALRDDADGVVIAHNHPSGFALPSKLDLITTQHIRMAMESAGIKLVDHIVYADFDYVSMADDEKSKIMRQNELKKRQNEKNND